MKRINDRLTRRPLFTGKQFKMKSMTIPGQDLTVQEIMNRFTQGGQIPSPMYSDENLSTFDRLNTMDKIDYIRDLKTRNHQMSESLAVQLNQLEATAKKQAKIDEQKAIIEKYKAEQPQPQT